jgi:hypothetical protein
VESIHEGIERNVVRERKGFEVDRESSGHARLKLFLGVKPCLGDSKLHVFPRIMMSGNFPNHDKVRNCPQCVAAIRFGNYVLSLQSLEAEPLCLDIFRPRCPKLHMKSSKPYIIHHACQH